MGSWSSSFLFLGPYSYLGAIVANITTHLGPEFYSGVVFLGSTPFRSWGMGIMSPWLAGMFPRVLSNELTDLCSTAREFTEALTFRPNEVHPGTKFAWIGAYTSQHPVARTNYINQAQDEDALKAAAGKVPVLVLLGKEDI